LLALLVAVVGAALSVLYGLNYATVHIVPADLRSPVAMMVLLLGLGTVLRLTSDVGGTVTVTPGSSALPAATPHVPAQVSFAAPPQAGLIAEPASGRAPLTVRFDARGSTAGTAATLDTFLWTFGDGNAREGDATETHVFQAPGSFRARLKVTDSFGSSGEAGALITVEDARGNRPPTATIVASATTGTDRLDVELSCDCAPGSAPLLDWEWDVAGSLSRGDKTKVTLEPGRYRVRLVVTDANGLTGRDELWITVNKGEHRPPECSATGTPAIAKAPVTVDYVGEYADGSRPVARYGWTMADGKALDGKDAFSNAYAAPGEYRTRFTAEDGEGLRCTDTHLAIVLGAGGGIAPAIISAPAKEAVCRAAYEYGNGGPVARGTGPFKWSVAKAPEGFVVNAETGAVAWTPTEAQQGSQQVVLAVETENGRDEQAWTVEVQCTPLPEEPLTGPPEGCGCGAGTGALAFPWFALLGLGVLRRRRA
ncbi:MAG: PKD domain-containing protein, partial [Myxococcales bacterium]